MIVTNKLKRPNSLAFRVTILVGITVFLCLTIISLIVQQSIATHFAEQDADELNEVMPASASMVVTAMAMPKRPARILVMTIPTTMISAGTVVASSDTAKPWITLVACPVVEASATERTGRYSVPV